MHHQMQHERHVLGQLVDIVELNQVVDCPRPRQRHLAGCPAMSGKVLEQQILLDGIYIRPAWEFADIDVWVELQGRVCVFDGDCDGCDCCGGGGGGGGGVVVYRDWVVDAHSTQEIGWMVVWLC